MKSTIVADSLAAHSGKSDRREWHTVGAWLHPGERIVIVHADDAALAEPEPVAWEQFHEHLLHRQSNRRKQMSSLNEYGIIPHNEQYKSADPEPAAWMVYTQDGQSAYVTDNPNDLVGAYRALPLYTTPPARQPLTDEEIDVVTIKCFGANADLEFHRHHARAVERAHKIGGNDE